MTATSQSAVDGNPPAIGVWEASWSSALHRASAGCQTEALRYVAVDAADLDYRIRTQSGVSRRIWPPGFSNSAMPKRWGTGPAMGSGSARGSGRGCSVNRSCGPRRWRYDGHQDHGGAVGELGAGRRGDRADPISYEGRASVGAGVLCAVARPARPERRGVRLVAATRRRPHPRCGPGRRRGGRLPRRGGRSTARRPDPGRAPLRHAVVLPRPRLRHGDRSCSP
ncbi:hypothetical protein SO3561_08727 [Streptomyces olivochromogenes]|uniref:Uncharacterized protein n=1 Tax=Streptomyces olivochromogenes TaxID=1963 RepID=A0A250VSH0_STROL|nr:hypothetical protein SO3561_08727 [Streptomyces olivochromogenes]